MIHTAGPRSIVQFSLYSQFEVSKFKLLGHKVKTNQAASYFFSLSRKIESQSNLFRNRNMPVF